MKSLEESYKELIGSFPPAIAARQALTRATKREEALRAVEQMRQVLLMQNPLDRRTQQLVHFGMLIALHLKEPARLHAAGALKAGATIRDLQGVAETAAVVCGMPGFGLASELIVEAAGLQAPFTKEQP